MTDKIFIGDDVTSSLKLTKERLTEMIESITKSLGFGLPESIYQNALDYELRNHLFSVEQEVNIDIVYGLFRVGNVRADIIVDQSIIIEMKAVDKIKPKHRSQLDRYLKFTKCAQGFLINISYDNYEIEEIKNHL